MHWQDQLITLYLNICKFHDEQGQFVTQRFSPNNRPSFTDEEVLCIYLFGLMKGYNKIQRIHEFARENLHEWFPHLGSYQGYNHRLNRLADVLPLMLQMLCEQDDNDQALLIDSFPVTLAKNAHRFKAKVAPQIASAGYCSAKKMFFYGVRVHVLARRAPGTLPDAKFIAVTEARMNDGKVFDLIRDQMVDQTIFADKAYIRSDAEHWEREHRVRVFTPVKKASGQKKLEPIDQWISTAVSSIRQPIEALFAWFQRKMDIEDGSRIRSYEGLMVHVFGRLLAAKLLRNDAALNS